MPKPPGLQNNGNTCYFNATLQSLYRTIVFRKNLEHISTLWRKENRVTLVNKTTSSENGFLDKVLFRVKKLLVNVQNGDLSKCFCLLLASLILYKAGSTGVLISAGHWILERPQFIKSIVQRLSSNVSDFALYVDHGASCSVMNFQQYLDLLQVCPRSDQPVVITSVYPWFAVVGLFFFGCKYRFFVDFFSEVMHKLSGKRLSSHVTDWWSSGNKVVLCSSGVLFYCTGQLMASSQPIYKCLLEHTPETMCVVFVMASSACLLFYHRRHITDAILSSFRNFFCQPEVPISVALTELFAEIDSESGRRYHNPRWVSEAVCRRSKRFYGFHQQDSHELLRHLLDGIREEERNLKQGTNSLTLVDRVFGGHFRTVYTCETCATAYCLYEAFLDISLPITLQEDTLTELSDLGDNETNFTTPKSQQYNIEFWLKVFTRTENLGKQYLCTTCNKAATGSSYELTHGKKQTLICDPPAVLCIHLKRFRKTTGDFVKANDHVEFSEYLDLKPYLTNDCQRVAKNQGSAMYSLFGVVVHSGSLEGGHYTAYIKSQDSGGQSVSVSNTEEFLQQEGVDWDSFPTEGMDKLIAGPLHIQQNLSSPTQTKEWYYCSDSTVMQVDTKDVFSQEAYLLFYERLR